jgi:predicted MFS family arabinose efflux permease
VLGVFFGPLADRFGYRLMMTVGLGLLVLGMFSAGLIPIYLFILAGLFLAGLGKTVFDPALQAYVGARVPFERRGLVIGILEVSWALSTLVGIPLMGLLIDGLGWRAPFFFLAGAGLLSMAILLRLVPRTEDRILARGRQAGGTLEAWRALIRDRTSLGMLGFAFFINGANDNLFVVYGAWLESAFLMTVLALGFTTTIIGAAELSGEFLTATLSDRLGLKRALILALILSSLSYIVLPVLGGTPAGAFLGLFLVFIFFEFTIVTAMSLSTELRPETRATMMAAFMAACGAGRVMGALIGGPVWQGGGIFRSGMVSCMLSLLGLAVLAWGLSSKKNKEPS